VYSNHAYVATDSGLYIVNVSNVSNPWEAGNYPYGGYTGIFMLNSPLKFIYLADIDVIRIIDVCDSSNPQLVDSVQTPGAAFDIWTTKEAGSEAYVFVADAFEGLGVYDCNQPSNVQWLYQYGEADNAYDVVVQGSYLYIADCRAGVKIIDISNPQSPQEIASFDHGEWWNCYFAIGIQETIIYTTSDDWVFRAVSIADPTSPYQIDSVLTQGYGRGSVAISETLAFKAESWLQGINIKDPANMDTLKSYDFGASSCYDIFAQDTLIFCALVEPSGLAIISYGDPNNPTKIGSLSTTYAGVGLWALDTFAYLGTTNELIIISISDPRNPYELGKISYNCHGVTVVDSLAYIGADYFRVLDVSDPTNIRELGYHSFGGSPQLWTDSVYVYCTNYGCGVIIYDFYGPNIGENHGSSLNLYQLPSIVRCGSKLRISYPYVVDLRDVAGRTVKTFKPDEEIDFTGLSTGIYFLIIRNRPTILPYKIVVIR